MSGCVNYSRRFYEEVLLDPVMASPVVFPETVFNAPSSHLAALLDTTAMNYTLVGDQGTFLLGLGLAAGWLWEGLVDECLVVGAEELDWLTADAFRWFTRQVTVSEGAGAVLLAAAPATEPSRGGVELAAVTDVHLFWDRGSRASAAGEVAEQLAAAGSGRLLCDGLQGVRRLDQAEAGAWAGWKGARISPKTVVGEGLMAAAAWQCVLAADAVRRQAYPDACVSVVGCNEQAMGVRFLGLGTGPVPKRSTGPGPGEGGGE
jgi:3-oxoacyl-(acyl-carrier-protein) synthase